MEDETSLILIRVCLISAFYQCHIICTVVSILGLKEILKSSQSALRDSAMTPFQLQYSVFIYLKNN